MSVSPNGKEVAFIARGEVFVTSVEGGVTKQITRTPETEASVTFSPDGTTLLYASERNGRWRIFQAKRAREAEPYFYASTLIGRRPVSITTTRTPNPGTRRMGSRSRSSRIAATCGS